jgi:SprT protein
MAIEKIAPPLALPYRKNCMQFDFVKRLFAPATPSAKSGAALPRQGSEGKTLSIAPFQGQATELLRKVGAPALADVVVVRWNPRLRNTAGLAYPSRNLVLLNPRLAQFGPDEIDRTLRHELAHLLAHHRAGRKRIEPHGPEWRTACRDLGLPNESRTHDLPLPRHRVPPKHFYRCPNCELLVPRVRPLKRASACLKCCRTHNGGRFDARFRFVKIGAPASPPEA